MTRNKVLTCYRNIFGVFVLVVFAGQVKVGKADSWLQFRGPNGTGRSETTYPLANKFEMEKQLVWKEAILPGQSSPIVVNNSVVFTGYEDGILSTVCLSIGKINVVVRFD